MIQYQNASDSTGNIFSIDKITPENRAFTQFLCIGCDVEMIPVLGNKRQHHFRHREDCKCSFETYLHKLGKRGLKERFNSQSQFNIQYFVDNALYISSKLR